MLKTEDQIDTINRLQPLIFNRLLKLLQIDVWFHYIVSCTCTLVTMAKIQFLTKLFIVTCFLGGVVSVTDKEFEVGAADTLVRG